MEELTDLRMVAGSTYQLELEHLIEAFRRSVLLGHESPLSPPASPRNVHPLHSLDHRHLGEPLIFCNDSSSEEFNTALCSDTGKRFRSFLIP